MTSITGAWANPNESWMVPEIFQARNIGWEEAQRDHAAVPSSFPPITRSLAETREAIVTAIRMGRHELALETMMTIVTSSSKMLADVFGMSSVGSSPAILVQQLKDDGIITPQEWNRLTVLLMSLDGLDIEVGEYGGKLASNTVQYALEYCQTVQQIMSRGHVDSTSSGQESIVIVDTTGNQSREYGGYAQEHTMTTNAITIQTHTATNYLIYQGV